MSCRKRSLNELDVTKCMAADQNVKKRRKSNCVNSLQQLDTRIPICSTNIGSNIDSALGTQQAVVLPNVVVKQILYNIQDQLEAMTCRLVCSHWNRITEDTPGLMRKITFPVWDANRFLDLQIVKGKKVKSISFINCTPLEAKFKERFIGALNNIVEKVQFKLRFNSSAKQQRELFHMVLEKFNCVQELTIDFEFEPEWSEPLIEGLFTGVTLQSLVSSAEKLKIITVSVHNLEKNDADGLVNLISILPRLEEINLLNPFKTLDAASIILTGLSSYVEKHGDDLSLKKLSFDHGIVAFYADGYGRLQILCLRHRLLGTLRTETIDFNTLLEIPSEKTKHSLQQRPLFTVKINGSLTIHGPPLANLDRLHSLKVQELSIQFERNVEAGELSWIPNLGKLEALILSSSSSLIFVCAAQAESQFLHGLSSLMELRVSADIFRANQMYRLPCYVPNLKTLYISDYESTLNDLIGHLTGFPCLTTLELSFLRNLQDEAFTVECVQNYSVERNDSLVTLPAPAIACFKSLKHLHIESCKLLTNACVLAGITKCCTLETLTIISCEKMTGDWQDLINCNYIFKKTHSTLCKIPNKVKYFMLLLLTDISN